MDRITKALAQYAESINYDRLPIDVVHEVKRRVLDSLAVAFAAYNNEPVALARRAISRAQSQWGARVLGTRYRVTPDWAAFVDGLMIRYHDFNDTYLSKEPLHPSDMIAAAFSLGDVLGSDGKSAITSIAIGYEAAVSLCDAASLRKHGWDHVNYLGVGSTLVASKLLGLDSEKTQHALAIYAVPHAAMRQTRVGELSMWKGAAAANATRNAVFAALLAAEGFTGPFKPFEGEMGFIRQLLSGEFDYGPLAEIERLVPPHRILGTYIKPYPVEYHAQTAVEAALRLREKVRAEEIEKITIETFQAAYDIIGPKDPEKWNPYTKETADHSIMWVTAAALLYGPITIDSYENIRDPQILSLMKKIEVRVDPELDKMYPKAHPNRITVIAKSGARYTEQVDYAKGHPKNPLSDRELEEKFFSNTRRVLPSRLQREVVEFVWHLEDRNMAELLDLLAS